VKSALIASALALAACGGDVDEQWQLDHDRIIAITLSKPGLLAGEQAEITGLLGHKGGPTTTGSPIAVVVPDVPGETPAPDALKNVVSSDASGRWFVTAPDDATLDAVRTQEGLMPTDPVPLQLGVAYSDTLTALTLVRFGVDSPNPEIVAPTLNGMPLEAGAMQTIDSLVKNPLSITIPETTDINWLTSVGDMHLFDLPQSAYIKVESDATMFDGEMGVVIRDRLGGVAWQIWPLHANPAPATGSSSQ
jgi:hypothetical protein